MHALRHATFGTLFIGATIAASAHADNALITGCDGSVARTDSEGGGVGYQPAPGAGARRAEAEGGGAATANMATHNTEAAADRARLASTDVVEIWTVRRCGAAV
jgi:hypothetical protein